MISPVKIWRNQKKLKDILGKTGKIIAKTIIRVSSCGFEDQAPYPLVIVKIGDKKYIGQLVDAKEEDVKLGANVKAIIRRVRRPHEEGIIQYGIKFKLL